MRRVLQWLGRIPAGLWAAAAVALTILGMYLRGRHLQAQIIEEKAKSIKARAKAGAMRHTGRAEVHREAVARHEARIIGIEQERDALQELMQDDSTRIATAPDEEVTKTYLDLVSKVPEE